MKLVVNDIMPKVGTKEQEFVERMAMLFGDKERHTVLGNGLALDGRVEIQWLEIVTEDGYEINYVIKYDQTAKIYTVDKYSVYNRDMRRYVYDSDGAGLPNNNALKLDKFIEQMKRHFGVEEYKIGFGEWVLDVLHNRKRSENKGTFNYKLTTEGIKIYLLVNVEGEVEPDYVGLVELLLC